MQSNPLEQAILRTVLYFDIFEYPLTATEIWKYLYRPELPESERDLMTIIEVLQRSDYLRERLTLVEGFYCRRGRESIIPERKRKNDRVDHQMRKTLRMVRWLRIFPWVRMIGIISSLPLGNVKQGSDIDLFIVAKKDTIWLTRLWVAGFLKILRQRPDTKEKKDRFCLSFFVTEDALDVSRASFGHDDIVFQYYILSIMPLYDPTRIYERFLEANAWLKKYVPNGFFPQIPVKQVGRPRWLALLHWFIDSATWPFFNGRLSDWYCNLQLRILPQNLKAIANIDTRVIISDQMLKFHDKDNRHQILKEWHERIHQNV